jgi:hypothetical protein
MQHLGAEDEMQQALRDILATLPPEDRLRGLTPEELRRGLAPDQMQQALRDILATLPPEELVRGLAPDALERLRRLLQGPAKADNSSPSE